MPRVLVPAQSHWYDELKAVGHYGETEFERLIRQHLETLFPDYHVFPFKTAVKSAQTGAVKKPDLAMIRHDFNAWGVIEVELEEHNLKHVLDQTQVFLDGTYNAPETAEYAKTKLEEHCKIKTTANRLNKLFSTEQPAVLVIADAHSDAWQKELNKVGIQMCVLEIYKNTRGSHIYRTSGQYPIVFIQETHCRRHPSLANVLEVVGNFNFYKSKVGNNNEVEIFFMETLTRWSVMDADGKRYLQFIGRMNPLSPNDTYCLFADKSHNYYFERS